MSQANPSIGANKPGLTYRNEDNAGKLAQLSSHKGSTAPSYAVAGTIWLDDNATPWLLKIYDGSDWITFGAVNATTNAFTPFLGTSGIKYLNYAADTGDADAYAVAPTPAISTYTAGQLVTLRPSANNTGNSTLAVSGLSAVNIKLLNSDDPHAGALLTSGIYHLVYNGTNFVLLNPSYAFGSAAFVDVIDEDDMDSDSETRPPSQQSVKAHVAAEIAANAQGYDPTTEFDFVEDFVDGLTVSIGTTVERESYLAGVTNHSGSGVINTGHARGIKAVTVSTATSTAYINSSTILTQQASGAYNVQALIQFAAVSDASQGYTTRLGMILQSVTGTVDPTNGIFFRQNHANNGGRWEAVCRASSTETVVDTGVAASTDKCLFEIRINAGNNSITFYINGALVATITTNIPANTTQMRFALGVQRTQGNADKAVYIDFFRLYTETRS